MARPRHPVKAATFETIHYTQHREVTMQAQNVSRQLTNQAAVPRVSPRSGQLGAYRHPGFWQCMDTPREYQLLNDLWKSGAAPWTTRWVAEKAV